MILSNEDLKTAQSLMLKILKEVHRICEENGIHYFLSDGTLIGAVRHNGFIPWDDDLDIGMLRADYDKFCSIAGDVLGDEFVIQNSKTDKGYGLQFSKVILKNTLWMEQSSSLTNRKYCGLFLDIFPYDKIPTDSKIQKKILKKYDFINGLILIKLKYFSFHFTNGLLPKIKFLIKWCITKFVRLEFLSLKRDKLCSKFEDYKSDFLITKYGGNFYKNQNSYESFSNLEKHKFEDSEFYIPKMYDKVLTNLYGDYMKLPPEEKRVNHGIHAFDFGKY
ncbi:MAG: LicD family protein [Treponema sp.]|nr:LicD family protein [Treponema sp.]